MKEDLNAFCDASGAAGERFLSAILDNCRKHVLITSCFSGMGTAEVASQLLEAAMECEPKTFIKYSACDSAKASRRVLSEHSEGTATEHLFGDIMHRLPEHVRQELQAVHKNKLSAYNKKASRHGKHSPAAKRAKHRLGQELKKEACDMLDGVEFLHMVWCYKHGGGLCAKPSLDA